MTISIAKIRQQCKTCGCDFEYHRVKKFCRPECRQGSFRNGKPIRRHKKKPRACVQCGSVFVSEKRRTSLCSMACVIAHKSARNPIPLIPCVKCGTLFKRSLNRHSYNKYCSRECYFGSATRVTVDPLKRSTRRLTKPKRMEICKRDKWKCQECGVRVRDDVDDRHPRKANVDHVIPVSLGGTNDPTNLQCLCRNCNAKKHAKKLVLF